MKQLIYLAAAIMLGTGALSAQNTPTRSEAYQQREQAIKDSLQDIKKKADAGDARSQCIVGNWFYTGKHVPQDYARAFDYYQKSAAGKNNTAIGNLGLCYEKGHGVKADSIKAMQYYLASIQNKNEPLLKQLVARADRGEALPAVTVGIAYVKQKDAPKATAYLTKGANAGSVDAMRELGVLLLNGKKGADAFKWFTKGADKGDATCIYYCGRMLREGGMGVKSDPAKGITYLLRAAEMQYPAAYYQLGQAYANGLGVAANPEQARKYYRLGASAGNNNAAFALARALVSGDNPDYIAATELFEVTMPRYAGNFKQLFEPSDSTLTGTPYHTFLRGMSAYEQKDFATAEKLFKEVDKKKIAAGKTMLAMIQLTSDNPKANVKKGAKSMADAWKGGDPRAAFILGGACESGTGVTRDEAKAMEYYTAAAAAGDPSAALRLGDIYYEGLLGQTRDLDKAMQYYIAAGPWRSQEAATRLADAYLGGLGGCPVDERAAERVLRSVADRSVALLIPYVPAK